MGVNPESLDKALDQIRKSYGEESVRYASKYPDVKRVPTGIIELDALTGGGYPLGRVVHKYGGYSSGKTLTSLHLIKEAQREGLTCAYYDLENQFSKKWAASVGVDTDSLLVLDGSIIEEVAEKVEALLGAVNIHIIDSLGIGVSQDELAAKVDEWRPGISARAWGKFVRRTNNSLNEDNMLVLVNQTRDSIGKMYATETPTGGRQIEHYSSLNLHFKKSSTLYKDLKGNLSKDGLRKDGLEDIAPSGVELVVKCTKSRVHDPLDSARFRLEFGTGGQFDQTWGLVRSLIFNGIVQKSGSWYELPDGNKVQGDNGLRVAIESDKNLAELAKKAMFDE